MVGASLHAIGDHEHLAKERKERAESSREFGYH
jgi:hypothetical protein